MTAHEPGTREAGTRERRVVATREEVRSGRVRSRPGTIFETDLANGIRVLSERIPGVRSAAVGVWVRQGAAHESGRGLGASHLLEHLVFKGTERRSAREIALALESLGGSLDAYTGREHTSFQARVMDEHLGLAVEVLADLVLHPLLREEDLELEREVVLEEISTVEDTPDDLIFEIHGERLWGGHPYGHSILGTRETVAAASAEELRNLHRRRYRGRGLVLAAAGRVEHSELVDLGELWFGNVPQGEPPPEVPGPPTIHPREEHRIDRPTAQTHVVFGSIVPGHPDPRRYPLILLSAALGGGMSSRLFQRVREELGLCYTIYSFQSFYTEAGVSGVYVGTRPGWGDQVVDAIGEELARVASEGLPGEELAQIKSQVKGQIMLSLESTGARLHRLASLALYDEPFVGLDDLLRKVDAVSIEEAAEQARVHFDPENQFIVRLGPDGGS